MSRETVSTQLLHPLSGDELNEMMSKDLDALDNAHMRHFVVHLHRLLEPDAASPPR